MAAINESIKAIWNEWKRLYDTSSDAAGKKISLENLQALDIADDGQKNNSLDKSLNVWDIQNPGEGQGSGSGSGPGSGSNSGSGSATETAFDKWWNQLPDDVKNKLKEKFAGDDGVFSDEEKGKTIEFVKSKTDNDDTVSSDEIETLRKELGITATGNSDTPDVGKTFDALMAQLPDDVKNKLKEKFAGDDGVFSDEEKGKAIEFVKSKTGNDDTATTEEVETLRKELGITGTGDSGGNGGSGTPDVNKAFDALMAQLPDDVRNKLKERFAGTDGEYSEEEKARLVDFVRSMAGTDDVIDETDITNLRKTLGITKLDKAEIDRLLDVLWPKLPEDLKKKLEDQFTGPDKSFSSDEMRQVAEFIISQAGADDDLSTADIDRINEGLKLRRVDAWLKQIPDDIGNKLKEKFAGSDGVYSDDEKLKLYDYIASIAGDDFNIHLADMRALRKDLGLPAPY